MARPYHHGDLAPALVSSARRLLRKASSISDLSIRAIARDVGVSPNAPYRHFANRQELLEAVAANGYREAARLLERSRAGGAESVAAAWQGIVKREPELVALMTGLRPSTAALREAIAEWLGAVADAIAGTGKDVDPVWLLARSVDCWAAVHGLTELRQAGLLDDLDDWLVSEPGSLAGRVVGTPPG